MQYATVIEDFKKALDAALAQTGHKMHVSFTLMDDKHATQPPNYLAVEISTSEPCNADLLRIVVRKPSRTEDALRVTYDSSGRGVSRPIVVKGTQREQVEKLMERLQIRYSKMVAQHELDQAEERAEKANAEQWQLDFVVDGKPVIPEKFAYASTPGRYSVNTDISQALRCNKWKREEVLELAMLLKQVRRQMEEDGRLLKPAPKPIKP